MLHDTAAAELKSDSPGPQNNLQKRARVAAFYLENHHWLHVCFTYKKAPRETQTLRAGCSKVEPKKIAPPQTPFPGAQDGQNLTSWRRSLPSRTDPVW